MTIRKGSEWGSIGPVPDDVVRVRSDAELHRLVVDARRAGAAIPPVALLGGALMRAVGGDGDDRRLSGEVPRLPCDLVRVELQTAQRIEVSWAAVHVLARRSWWRGPLVAAMNGQFLDEWDVAPRAHPNDGRVDVVEVDRAMPVRDRWRARGRLPAGMHVPHPAITTRQRDEVELVFERPLRVWADGVEVGEARVLRLVVEPDAFVVCV
ncbi:MAG: hypothetical protein U0Q03_13410 [Acidimicrobiales bacterium]